MISVNKPEPIRRVVVGVDQGKPVVLSDQRQVRHFEHLPGFTNTLMWATSGRPQVGDAVEFANDPAPAISSFLPPVGGTRFMVVTFPPDSSMADPAFDGAAFGAEVAQKVPGLAQTFEQDNPAMHTTDSVDYGVVLSGEIWLDLGTGEEVHLKQHEVVVQHGNRHGWRNKGTSPVTMLFVLVGAERK